MKFHNIANLNLAAWKIAKYCLQDMTHDNKGQPVCLQRLYYLPGSSPELTPGLKNTSQLRGECCSFVFCPADGELGWSCHGYKQYDTTCISISKGNGSRHLAPYHSLSAPVINTSVLLSVSHTLAYYSVAPIQENNQFEKQKDILCIFISL